MRAGRRGERDVIPADRSPGCYAVRVDPELLDRQRALKARLTAALDQAREKSRGVRRVTEMLEHRAKALETAAAQHADGELDALAGKDRGHLAKYRAMGERYAELEAELSRELDEVTARIALWDDAVPSAEA